MGFLIGLLWLLLAVVMLLLLAVILLQEGKGGGLAEAFGGVGAETFGVKATGINRFTGILGGVFLVLVIVINLLMKWDKEAPVVEQPPLPAVEAPAADEDG